VHDGVVDVEAETMGCWRHGSCQLEVVAAAARSMLAELGYRRSGTIARESRGKRVSEVHTGDTERKEEKRGPGLHRRRRNHERTAATKLGSGDKYSGFEARGRGILCLGVGTV
jgi:hypothetical protein